MPDLELSEKNFRNVGEINAELGKLKEKPNLETTELLKFILSSAIGLRSSDVHFETGKDQTKIKLRVDGLLYETGDLNEETYSFLLNRLKLLSGLKINVKDAPQDGRFTVKLGDKNIEIRTSTIPAEFGETIVLRILDPQAISLQIGDLGLNRENQLLIHEELKQPNGMVLVTGPTGSGKTTTLYAFLKAVKKPELKIITIEDPIEYHLEDVEQTQVDEEADYVFSSGLKSILRQDPDVILVGEIRDKETAEIAIHASLTGHLVFSTLHTNNASGAIPRLVDLGVQAPILGSALNLILAQRLVRKLCPSCKREIELDGPTSQKLKAAFGKLPKAKIYKAEGCSECIDGYKGRVGVFEIMKVSERLKALIEKEMTESGIAELARKEGMKSLQADGIEKVFEGITSLEEVERVTGPIRANKKGVGLRAIP